MRYGRDLVIFNISGLLILSKERKNILIQFWVCKKMFSSVLDFIDAVDCHSVNTQRELRKDQQFSFYHDLLEFVLSNITFNLLKKFDSGVLGFTWN